MKEAIYISKSPGEIDEKGIGAELSLLTLRKSLVCALQENWGTPDLALVAWSQIAVNNYDAQRMRELLTILDTCNILEHESDWVEFEVLTGIGMFTNHIYMFLYIFQPQSFTELTRGILKSES